MLLLSSRDHVITYSRYHVSLRDRLHARALDFEDADDVAVILFLFDFQLAFDRDLIRAVADGFALGAVDDDRVLDLRWLAEAAGEQTRHERELRDALGLVHRDHEAVQAKCR